MGTNYFGKIIPSKERKKELHDAIESDDFSLIKKLVNEMYGSIDRDDDENIVGGIVHLGKRSGGWKFLWNPNVYVERHGHREYVDNEDGHTTYRWKQDPSTLKYLYPLTKEGIKAFIDREDVEIYDEYGEKQDKEEFWKMALDWTTWGREEALDADSYHAKHPYESAWTCKSELTDLLEKEGYNLSWNKSDFYSDGLRFSTLTEFS